MAYTKIHAIKSTLNKAIAYIENPDKTDGQLLISGYNVEPLMASVEFEMTSALAREVKGNYTKTGGGNNLAYHMIQSFAHTDNITKEQAHELGKQLANEYLDGKYEYVIATHIDKKGIHNHIIYNAVSFYDYKKARTVPYKTASQIRAISDRLCSENDLSVIKANGKRTGKSYTEYMEIKTDTSLRATIRAKINYILETAVSFEEFKNLLLKLDIEVNTSGKNIKYLSVGHTRAVRGKSLDNQNTYTEKEILIRLAENLENQAYIKTAIREASARAAAYDEVKFILQDEYGIKTNRARNGDITYNIDDQMETKVKERALGKAYSEEEIKKAIKSKNYEFSEQNNGDIKEEYNKSLYPKTKLIDTNVVIDSKNVYKITSEGILLEIPNENGNTGKVFIANVSFDYNQNNDTFEVHLGEKFDYFLTNEHLNDDINIVEQLSTEFVKGEYLIRAIETQNKIECSEIKLSGSEIKSLSPKGVVISMPEQGIDSLFIESKYIKYDKLLNMCFVKIGENWNYSFLADAENKKSLSSIKGKDIIQRLKNYEGKEDNSLHKRIVATERKTALIDTKELAAIQRMVRNLGMTKLSDFQTAKTKIENDIGDLKAQISEIGDKTSKYRQAAKYLVTRANYSVIHENYLKQSLFSKKKYEERFENELKAYNYAEQELEKMSVNNNVDAEKVIELIKNQEEKIKLLQTKIEKKNGKIEELKQAKEQIEKLQNEKQQGKTNKNKEREI